MPFLLELVPINAVIPSSSTFDRSDKVGQNQTVGTGQLTADLSKQHAMAQSLRMQV